jgi:rSAM/selenodomain-associated transferase 1
MASVTTPVKGTANTRPPRPIGVELPPSVHKHFLVFTQLVTQNLPVDKQIWYSRFINQDDRWPNESYQKHLQEGEDLGVRMRNAFRNAFADGYEKAVIIGSDCSALTPCIIKDAFRQLDEYPVVIGPAQDGGYYLLGMSEYYPDLFKNKEWSTSSVFEKTTEQLREMDISYYRLPILNDIDTLEDLKASKLTNES